MTQMDRRCQVNVDLVIRSRNCGTGNDRPLAVGMVFPEPQIRPLQDRADGILAEIHRTGQYQNRV